MERAAGHLCAIAERASCDEAKAKLQRARDKVRSTCGGCA
jgi:hypothetical protein